MTAERHTSEAFLSFLDRVVATQPKIREIHIICDSLSAHKTKAVRAWLEQHALVAIHYTPTYSSWLNQVEIWFSKIQRDLISRGVFTSTTDLRRKLMAYTDSTTDTADRSNGRTATRDGASMSILHRRQSTSSLRGQQQFHVRPRTLTPNGVSDTRLRSRHRDPRAATRTVEVLVRPRSRLVYPLSV